ncbi:DNA (cytosine-5-)-methyltransferase [Sarracenia purpurea var. burkii]
MNGNELELDRKVDMIDEGAQSKSRVLGDGGAVRSAYVFNSVGNRGPSSGLIDSDKNKVSLENVLDTVEEVRVSAELENRAPESDVRNDDVTQKVNDHKLSACNGMPGERGPRVKNFGVHSEEKGIVEVGKPGFSEYESMISKFDEFARNGNGKTVRSGQSISVGYGYEIGDLVWGKVKSHPWWPGHIYNEAFASSSVRRTKRPGHVLVAFFGDSSYGWFDPAELIPFDPNFSEKSSQTNSRNFVKAVEEAVDEVNRRRGLGLACRCRNPYNFRPTNVRGYFVVDVDDYEPGGLYSMSTIRKSRDSFKSRDTVAFVKQLALIPRGDGHGSIDFIKNRATVMAYRKAVFEEFDETYAQAFGQQPVRPIRAPVEAVTLPLRAPLSGPMVYAEALGKKKHATKLYKAKDQTSKDKYLFKRRDESNELKIQQMGQKTSFRKSSYVDETMESSAGDYVMQKRPPLVSTKQQTLPKLEQIVETGKNTTSASIRDTAGAEVAAVEDKPVVARLSVASSSASGRQAHKGHFTTIVENSGLSGREASHGGIDGMPFASEPAKTTIKRSKMVESFQQPPSLATVVEEIHGQEEEVHVPLIDGSSQSQGAKMRIDIGKKKAKLGKRPVGELVAEKSVPGEKKKKKKKREKELGMEISFDSIQKRVATGKGDASVERVTGKSVQVGLPPREDFQIEHQKKEVGARSSLLPDSLGSPPSIGMGSFELKLPHLLSDLQALALDPFHGWERSSPAVIRQAFLKFRSHVFQKSLALSTPAEMEFNEVNNVSKPPSGGTSVSEFSPRENIKNVLSLKAPKPSFRPDDPTRSGRKRGPSDRQVELVAKRVKKIIDIKSGAVQKAAQRTTPEAHRDGKEPMAASRPSLKASSVKKNESPPKAPEPATLVMKFPPNTGLPSGSELKARLARFGPLDHSGTRVFWKSSSCRVVFIHRADAEAAHRHLTGNNTLFGNLNVRSHVRLLEVTAPESESKPPREDAPPIETLPFGAGPAVEQRPPAVAAIRQSGVQLKSCLKKPMGGDELVTTAASSGGNGSGRGTRVKFMLGGGGGESSGGGEQLMIGNKNNFNNTSFGFADGGASSSSSSSHGMDFISKNFQNVVPPPLPLPILPLPPATTTSSFPNSPNVPRYFELTPRNASSLSTKNDIAEEMLKLLTKCNEVVAHLVGSLGYAPYQPL